MFRTDCLRTLCTGVKWPWGRENAQTVCVYMVAAQNCRLLGACMPFTLVVSIRGLWANQFDVKRGIFVRPRSGRRCIFFCMCAPVAGKVHPGSI